MRNLDNNYYSEGQDITFVMTTPQEERDLFEKAHNGDEEAREFLIRNHLLFALRKANQMVRGALPKNEVISAANYAVMKAFGMFKPALGHRFSTYLHKFIKGEISQLWKSKFNGDSPDPSIGGRGESGHRPKKFSEIANDKSSRMLGPAEREEQIRANFGEVAEPEAEESDLSQFNRGALARALAKFSEKDRTLLTSVYFEEKSFAEIGRERGVTREAIRASHKRLLVLLKKRVVREGVER